MATIVGEVQPAARKRMFEGLTPPVRPCAATGPEVPGDELLLLGGALLFDARVDGCPAAALWARDWGAVCSHELGHIRGRSPNITGPYAHW